MYNILLDKLPKTVIIDNIQYDICWGWRAGVLIEIVMFSTRSDEQKILDALNIFYMENIPPNWEKALNKMLWFFRGGKSNKKGKTGNSSKVKRAYCFEKDAEYIYAAFQTQYNINLNSISNTDLHWWEFSAMFDSLDEDLKISRIMYYRTADTKGMSKNQQKFIRKMRSIYAIPSADSDTDDKAKLAKRNADMKAYVRKRMEECKNG